MADSNFNNRYSLVKGYSTTSDKDPLTGFYCRIIPNHVSWVSYTVVSTAGWPIMVEKND